MWPTALKAGFWRRNSRWARSITCSGVTASILAVSVAMAGTWPKARNCRAIWSARAEALSHDGLSASDLFNVDFDGIDQSSPVVQIGGNPVLMTMVNTTDSGAARNIKNWY